MKSFYVKDGCFYFRGRPFIKTSAYGGGSYLISLPEELVDTDKNLYLKAGFTTAEYWPRWDEVEPADGVWNLEPLETLLKRARRINIAVFIHFDPSPPQWMIKKYDWHWITETGMKVPIRVAGSVPHDENYIREMENYVKHIIDVVKEYDDVVADYWLCGEKWPLMSEFGETSIYGRCEDASYDDYTVSKFRKWLAEKFSLEELGLRWNNDENTYSSWNEVYPPVSLRPTDFKGRKLANWKAARWDWYKFKEDVYVYVWTTFCNLVYKYDPYRPISLEVNMDLPGFAGHGRWYKVCARAKNARAGIQDFEASYVRALYYIAASRGSSDPPNQVNEMSGFQDYRWCIRNTWFIQAMGGTGMTFWDFKSDYWGLVTGRTWRYNEREKPQFKESYLAVRDLNEMFRKAGDVFAGSRPIEPSIGILLLDEDSFHESGVAVSPVMQYLSTLLNLGYGPETIILTEEGLERGAAKRLKLIIAPHIKYISEENARRLEEYVREGGILLIGPFAGQCDEKGEFYQEIPCEPLAKVAGIKAELNLERETLLHVLRAREYLPERIKAGNWLLETMDKRLGEKTLRAIRRTLSFDFLDSVSENLSKETLITTNFHRLKKGEKIPCIPAQKVTPVSDKVSIIGTCDGKPSIVLNRYGEGYAMYLTSDFRGMGFVKLLESVLALAGLTPYAKVLSSVPGDLSVIWGIRKTPQGFLVILIENSDAKQEFTLRLNVERLGLKDKKYSVKEILSGKEYAVDVTEHEVKGRLEICEVKIFHITASN